jgi:hypothetical protein
MGKNMKGILTRNSQILLSLFLMLVLFGCAAPAGSRLYSGELRPRQDVALIMPIRGSDGGLLIRGIRCEKDNKEIDFDPYRGDLELLPGKYSIAVSSFAHSSNSSTTTDYVSDILTLDVNAKANHSYIITYGIYNSPKLHWTARITDLKDLDSAEMNDIKEIENMDPMLKAIVLSKSAQERIMKQAEGYFQRERLPKLPTSSGWR